MPRPQRIKSDLYGSSPLDQPASECAPESVAGPPAVQRPKVKRTFYFYRETSERMLNAAAALAATPSAPRGPSDLVAEAVERYVDYLQDTFNGGASFPRRTGPLQHGPRIG